MNWLLIVIIIVLGFNAYLGMKKGMVKIVLSLIAVIATVILTMGLTPVVSNYLKQNTGLYANIKQATYKSLEKNNTVDKAFTELGETENITYLTDVNQPESNLLDITGKVVSKLTLPSSLQKEIQSRINIDQYVSQGITSVKEMVTDALAEQITAIIFNFMIFLVVFVAIYIIMQIIIRVIDIVSMLPVIKQINKSGGLVLGLIKGLIVVWVFFIVMTIFCDTGLAHTVFAYINESSFLAFLYNNNLILKLIFAII